nr:Hint domain-containing protein [Roseibacterium persicicum]
MDLPDDGQTPIGSTIAWSVNGSDQTPGVLIGVTSEGEPLIQQSSVVFVLSNSSVLTSATVSESAYAYCFAPGTFIGTPSGETTVETLHIGDLVTTADGRAVPVKWIGHQTVAKLFAGERACPVRVAKGALGEGLPHTDLVLTADHALILDGLAINAGALVNGTTITLEPLSAVPDRVTYYHVETEDHDVILANGAAAETFIDYADRRGFDNHAEYIALYGEDRIITEMPLPRISTARLVAPALRKRLAGEAAA